MRIRIVYHVFAAHRWETVARSLVTKLVWSGLYDACRDVSVVAYGPERERTPAFFVRFGRKIHVTVAGGGGVARTLRGLRDTVGAGEAVLFLHTKGTDVAEPSESLEDWREFMDYWLIARWRECTSALNSHDVAGCNYYPESSPHFSGNQWWARGAYVRSLRPPETMAGDPITTWICGGAGARIYQVAASGRNHMESACAPREYLDLRSPRDDLRDGARGSACLLAVLTHQWTPEMRRRWDRLDRSGAGDAVVVACAADALPVPPDVRAFEYGYDAIRAAYPGLGDIRTSTFAALAFLYERHPDYEYYWLFENDVVYDGDISGFFRSFVGDPSDYLVPTCHARSAVPDPPDPGPGASPEWYVAPTNRIVDPSGTLAEIPTHAGLAVVQRYSRRFLRGLVAMLRRGAMGQCESFPHTLAHSLGMSVSGLGPHHDLACCDWHHRFERDALPGWTAGKLVHAVKLDA